MSRVLPFIADTFLMSRYNAAMASNLTKAQIQANITAFLNNTGYLVGGRDFFIIFSSK
jgi:hypothetical protein